MSLQKDLFIGLMMAGMIYFTVYVFGQSYYVLTLQLYSYIILALIISARNKEIAKQSLTDFQDRLLFVVDKDEKRVRKIFTGEEFKIENAQKIQ